MVVGMRRLVSAVVRSPLPLAAVLYTLARYSAVTGTTPARFPDSTGWLTLDFWGRNDRLWPVPLVYSIAGSDDVRVVAHVVIGAAAWTWFAGALAVRTRWPRAAALVVLAIGLTPQVVRYDAAILGESLTTSIIVALAAASLQLAVRRAGPLPWLALVAVFGLMRPTHLTVLVPMAAWFVASAIRSRGARHTGAAVLLGAAAVWGLALARGNDATSRLNIYTVIAQDVIVDDARFAWWVERGMPAPAGVREASGYDFAGDLPADLAAIVELPAGQQPPAVVRAGGVELAEWVRKDGLVTQIRWVLTHPVDAWNHAASRAAQVLSPPNDDFLPLDTRTVAPREVFGDWRLWAVLWVAGTLAAFVRASRRAEGRMLAVAGLMCAALFVATMNFSGIEHQRHGASLAVGLRVLGLAGMALLVPTRRLSRADGSDGEPGARTTGDAGQRRGRGRRARPTTHDNAE